MGLHGTLDEIIKKAEAGAILVTVEATMLPSTDDLDACRAGHVFLQQSVLSMPWWSYCFSGHGAECK